MPDLTAKQQAFAEAIANGTGHTFIELHVHYLDGKTVRLSCPVNTDSSAYKEFIKLAQRLYDSCPIT